MRRLVLNAETLKVLGPESGLDRLGSAAVNIKTKLGECFSLDGWGCDTGQATQQRVCVPTANPCPMK